ncbi:energy transducer TonB [Hyphomicrobium sp. LHD-15]|uniref:energy transducer TonB n=1 Tax=Hyphomicrobium sp. LHD-15 TaxID=3072142 RepID=UPI00280D1556|nr:energy transducer TonB [Hyphomicrobium sp. LHD-15]MDQ8700008.1 energy transducer TonB [Hyphomicrobium sp. LHD-15]
MITAFDILEPSWRRWRRWAGAGMLVLALHVGGAAAALWQWEEAEVDTEPEGAMLLELAPMAVSSPDPPEMLAIGPKSDEAPEVAPVEEVKEVKPEEELPQLEEAPLVKEPEVALEKVKPIEEEEKPEEEKKEQERVQAQSASIAAAPPPIEAAAVGPKPAAPLQGNSRKPNQAEVSWQKALHLHISKHKRYPSQAREKRVQGVVTVSFSIDGAGHVTNVKVLKGSGSPLLDEEAVEILQRAAPLPAPPDQALETARNLSLPIQFNIR